MIMCMNEHNIGKQKLMMIPTLLDKLFLFTRNRAMTLAVLPLASEVMTSAARGTSDSQATDGDKDRWGREGEREQDSGGEWLRNVLPAERRPEEGKCNYQHNIENVDTRQRFFIAKVTMTSTISNHRCACMHTNTLLLTNCKISETDSVERLEFLFLLKADMLAGRQEFIEKSDAPFLSCFSSAGGCWYSMSLSARRICFHLPQKNVQLIQPTWGTQDVWILYLSSQTGKKAEVNTVLAIQDWHFPSSHNCWRQRE